MYEKNYFHTSHKKICKNHSGKIRQPIKRIHGWLYQSFRNCLRHASWASVVKDVDNFVKTYKVPTVGVKELATRECLEILSEVEDYFWGDRSGFNKIMYAQMVFAKELRKRIASLQPNVKTQK